MNPQVPPVQLPPLQPLNPQDPLDNVLMNWEAEMMKVQTLAAQLDRTETDLAFKSTKQSTGYAQYMKVPGDRPINLAMMDMREKANPKVLVEKFICTGTYLYQYSPAQQVIRAYKMPEPPPGQVANDNFLAFLFGMRAQEAKRRYELKLTKQDQHYFYIDVLPRLPQDKADFAKAQVVLNRGSFLPRMLWFEQNGSTTTWDIPAIRSGVQVDRAGFDAPKPPQGWKLIEVPPEQQGQPKLIRGQ
jgi:TIGR03009 family protein